MALFRQLWHLATRFFGTVLQRPLGPRRQDEVHDVLTGSEAELFFRQQAIDQRHAYAVAQRVQVATGDPDAVAAALLHDVGKTESQLGPMARSLATLLDVGRLPVPSRWRAYRDHGQLGAAILAEAGARPLAVAFAAGEPAGDPVVWQAMVAADEASGWQRLASVRLGETPDSGGSRNTMRPEVNR